MSDYTEEMIKQLKFCSGCRKYRYCGECATCENCRKRKADKRSDVSEKANKCNKEGCNNTAKENGFCGKHFTERMEFEEQTRKHGFKPCVNSIRGCRNQLSTDCKFSRCEECREKERIKDHERRGFNKQITNTLKQIQEKISDDPPAENSDPTAQNSVESQMIDVVQKPKIKITVKPVDTNKDTDGKKIIIVANKVHLTDNGFYTYDGEVEEGKHCTRCGHFYGKKEFVGVKGDYVDTCLIQCRSANHRADAKRDRSDRDYSEYERRPEVKERRKLWKEQNIEKCRIYWKKFRAKMIIEDQEGYLKHNAEVQKAYRKSHPEKCTKMYDDAKKSVVRKEYVYKKSASDRGIQYNLTSVEACQLFRDKCFYCGYKPVDGYLNGIDRLDNEGEYEMENCVTACPICNYMKECLDPLIFIDMCSHILTHIGKINGALRLHIFSNFWTGYKSNLILLKYKSRAERRKLDWLLSIDEFKGIIELPCYLCGKLSIQPEHTNGIDRYDNKIGYITQNCRPCCGNCNYLKGKLDYDVFINKLIQIYENNCLKELVNTFNDECRQTIINNVNEKKSRAEYLRNYRLQKGITKTQHIHKTPEEKKEHERIRKQEYRAKKKQESQKFIDEHADKV
jgi:hypothetical protein